MPSFKKMSLKEHQRGFILLNLVIRVISVSLTQMPQFKFYVTVILIYFYRLDRLITKM